jgi:hypothetical protein
MILVAAAKGRPAALGPIRGEEIASADALGKIKEA